MEDNRKDLEQPQGTGAPEHSHTSQSSSRYGESYGSPRLNLPDIAPEITRSRESSSMNLPEIQNDTPWPREMSHVNLPEISQDPLNTRAPQGNSELRASANSHYASTRFASIESAEPSAPHASVEPHASAEPSEPVEFAEPSAASAAAPAQHPVRFFLNLVLMVGAVVLVSWLLRAFVVQPYEIPSGSMETTIMTNDLVFSEKISYRFGSVNVGDIVTFDDPNSAGRVLIKRVIATEGQTITLKDGLVYVDGKALSESYTHSTPSYELTGYPIKYPYTVPEGCIWVMGDNRTHSADSRAFGAIPLSSITGRAFMIYWPLDRIGLL